MHIYNIHEYQYWEKVWNGNQVFNNENKFDFNQTRTRSRSLWMKTSGICIKFVTLKVLIRDVWEFYYNQKSVVLLEGVLIDLSTRMISDLYGPIRRVSDLPFVALNQMKMNENVFFMNIIDNFQNSLILGNNDFFLQKLHWKTA